MNANWNALMEEHEIAHLRGDLATSSPESYTLEEMKAISEGMDASTAAVDAALRADFQSMPEHAQALMMEMLCSAGAESEEFWKRILLA